MAFFIPVDTERFDSSWDNWVKVSAPEQVIKAVNEVAKAIRKDLVTVSPTGPEPGPQRQRRRAQKGSKGKGYGPIRKAWSRTATKSIKKAAVVVNKAFYAPLVEFGSTHSRARPFAGITLRNAPTTAQQVLDRILRG